MFCVSNFLWGMWKKYSVYYWDKDNNIRENFRCVTFRKANKYYNFLMKVAKSNPKNYIIVQVFKRKNILEHYERQALCEAMLNGEMLEKSIDFILALNHYDRVIKGIDIKEEIDFAPEKILQKLQKITKG